MKNVALYIAGIGTGGIESCSISQYCFMDKNKVNVEFLVDTPPTENFNVQKIIDAGGKIVSCFSTVSKSKFRKFARPFAFIQTVRKHHYDVVHLHISNPTALFYAFLCKCFTSARDVTTSHAQGVANCSIHYIKLCRFCAQHLSLFCDVRLGDSLLACKWMFADRKSEVMLNGIDTESLMFKRSERRALRQTLGVRDDEILIGHVGRFAIDKNHEFIIDIFDNYYKNHSNAKLLLIGKGDLKHSIEKKCESKNLSERVLFIDCAPILSSYYWAMDLFLFPSLREGFGLVAIEAQAASLPVLASSAVPKETTQSMHIAYANLNDDIQYWVNKIDALLLSEDKRDTFDRSMLCRNCDIRNISNELVQIYNSL